VSSLPGDRRHSPSSAERERPGDRLTQRRKGARTQGDDGTGKMERDWRQDASARGQANRIWILQRLPGAIGRSAKVTGPTVRIPCRQAAIVAPISPWQAIDHRLLQRRYGISHSLIRFPFVVPSSRPLPLVPRRSLEHLSRLSRPFAPFALQPPPVKLTDPTISPTRPAIRGLAVPADGSRAFALRT
jgi:hypothetical protein